MIQCEINLFIAWTMVKTIPNDSRDQRCSRVICHYNANCSVCTNTVLNEMICAKVDSTIEKSRKDWRRLKEINKIWNDGKSIFSCGMHFGSVPLNVIAHSNIRVNDWIITEFLFFCVCCCHCYDVFFAHSEIFKYDPYWDANQIDRWNPLSAWSQSRCLQQISHYHSENKLFFYKKKLYDIYCVNHFEDIQGA